MIVSKGLVSKIKCSHCASNIIRSLNYLSDKGTLFSCLHSMDFYLATKLVCMWFITKSFFIVYLLQLETKKIDTKKIPVEYF